MTNAPGGGGGGGGGNPPPVPAQPNAREQAKANALLAEGRDLLAEIKDLTQDNADIRDESIAAEVKLNALIAAREKLVQDIAEGTREAVDSADLDLQAATDAVKVAIEQRDAIESQSRALSEKIDYMELQGGYSQAEIDALKHQKSQLDGQLGPLADILKLLVKQAKEQAKLNKLNEDAKGIAGDLLGSTLGISDAWESSNIGKFMDLKKTLGFAGALNKVGEKMSEALTPANILGSTVMMMYEATIGMVMATDEAISSFKKATGAGAEYDNIMMAATIDSRQFSAGMKEASAAMQTLFTDMSGFTELSADAKAETIAFTAGMEKLGVAGSDTAEIMDHAMKGWGMSLGQAQGVSKELLATATALQVPPGKMAKDFNMAMKELGKYGPEGVEVFKGLAAQAKASGMEVSSLLAIAGKFDTIEGAAGAVGELNAILGVNLNSMEMLNATEEERITLLQQSVAQSGKSWKSMDRFEKQAVAQAAGISDMSEANRLFGQGLDVYNDASAAAHGATAAQADMAAMTEASTSIQEKLGLVMERMAVLVLPLIYVVRWLVESMLAMMDMFYAAGKGIEKFGKALGPLGAPLQFLGWIVKELSGPLGFMAIAFGLSLIAYIIFGSYLAALWAKIKAKMIDLGLTWEQISARAISTAGFLKEIAATIWSTAVKWAEAAVNWVLVTVGWIINAIRWVGIIGLIKHIALTTLSTIKKWAEAAVEWVLVKVGMIRGAQQEAGILTKIKDIALSTWTTAKKWAEVAVDWALVTVSNIYGLIKSGQLLTKIKDIALTAWSTTLKWAEVAVEWALVTVSSAIWAIKSGYLLLVIKDIALTAWSTALKWAEVAVEWALVTVGMVLGGVQGVAIAGKIREIALDIWQTALRWGAVAVEWALVAAKAALSIILGIATIATWAFNVALYANPIGLVVLAVIALIAVLYFFPEIIDLVVSGFTFLWDVMIAYYTFLWDVFVGVWSFLYDAILMVPDAIVYLWDTFVGFFTEAGSWMDWLLGIGVFFAPFIAIPLLIVRHWDAIMDFFVGLWDGIVGVFNWAVDLVVGLFTSPVDTVMGIWEGLTGFFGSLMDSIVGVFKTAGDLLMGILKSPINILIDAINWMIGMLNTISFGPLPDWIPLIGGMEFGINIPLIPQLKEGGMVTQGGIAEVHKGEMVVSAEQAAQMEVSKEEMQDEQADLLDQLRDIVESGKKGGGGLLGTIAKTIFDPLGIGDMLFGGAGEEGEEEEGAGEDMLSLIQAIEKNTAAISALASAQGGGEEGGGKQIILQLDGRELGRAVTNSLNEQNNLSVG